MKRHTKLSDVYWKCTKSLEAALSQATQGATAALHSPALKHLPHCGVTLQESPGDFVLAHCDAPLLVTGMDQKLGFITTLHLCQGQALQGLSRGADT